MHAAHARGRRTGPVWISAGLWTSPQCPPVTSAMCAAQYGKHASQRRAEEPRRRSLSLLHGHANKPHSSRDSPCGHTRRRHHAGRQARTTRSATYACACAIAPRRRCARSAGSAVHAACASAIALSSSTSPGSCASAGAVDVGVERPLATHWPQASPRRPAAPRRPGAPATRRLRPSAGSRCRRRLGSPPLKERVIKAVCRRRGRRR